MTNESTIHPVQRRRRIAEAVVFAGLVGASATTAIVAKEGRALPALASVVLGEPLIEEPALPPEPEPDADAPPDIIPEPDLRWFNGRPVRPAKTITMRVTAYSPDARSCGKYADGQTATLHSVWTNGTKLVAADTSVLPYGSMISVPGYDAGRIVPVLDCGGAIKGHRLDVLYPTHEEALAWGVRTLDVLVWEYADGSPIENPRKLR